MTSRFFAALAAAFLSCLPTIAFAQTTAATPKRLLIVTVTKGFRHADSIPVAEQIIPLLGEAGNKWTVEYVRNDDDMARKMTVEALKGYDGVVFASTTGELPLPDRDGFLQWIRDGHAFIGMHAATDTFHKWPAYQEMIGGHFKTHGPQVTVDCLNQDLSHPAMFLWGKDREVHDEIYQFDNYDPSKFHHLIDLDKHPNNKTPGEYPIAWCKLYGKGRVFYTALGHRPDVWRSAFYQHHIYGGMLWALGFVEGDASLPTKTAQTNPPAPSHTNRIVNAR